MSSEPQQFPKQLGHSVSIEHQICFALLKIIGGLELSSYVQYDCIWSPFSKYYLTNNE